MVVNFELLGDEPIENVITCMHFRVDKVVFFGYYDVVQKRRKCTENFLKKYCGVQNVVFHSLSSKDLQSVLKTMRMEIQREKGNRAKIYFDVTGGESLILIAVGILSKEFKLPLHIYDVPSDKLIELGEGESSSISRDVQPQKIELNLENYIEMMGGVINWGLHKDIKEDGGDEFIDDLTKIWKVARKHIDIWNPFSDFLRTYMIPDEALLVRTDASTVINALNETTTKLNTVIKLNDILDGLMSEGILLDLEHAEGRYRFRFKNQSVKECLWEGGSILELLTYRDQKKNADDCMVGVHLDWDGVIHEQPGEDVVNEIDVLSLKGNVPTFISCKSGKMSPTRTLHALYELDAVAKKFGGKYAKKILVSAKELSDVYLARAEEMGIEVK